MTNADLTINLVIGFVGVGGVVARIGQWRSVRLASPD